MLLALIHAIQPSTRNSPKARPSLWIIHGFTKMYLNVLSSSEFMAIILSERKHICHAKEYKRSIDRDDALVNPAMRITIAYSPELQQ